MTSEDLKQQIRDWARRVGVAKAQAILVASGVGLSTTAKLISGTYTSEPKGRIREALEGILSKDAKRKAS